jgi:hypothetical protein
VLRLLSFSLGVSPPRRDARDARDVRDVRDVRDEARRCDVVGGGPWEESKEREEWFGNSILRRFALRDFI